MTRLVVVMLLSGALLAGPAFGTTSDPGRTTATWAGLDVPFVSVGSGDENDVSIRFRGTEVAVDELSGDVDSIAASADSAVLLLNDDRGVEFGGPLFEIGADGTTGVVERHALGIPIADPRGHFVFWTSRRSSGARLIAYDTRTHDRVRGPVVARDMRVFAVQGDEAFVADSIDEDVSAGTWRPDQPDVEPLTVPSRSDDGAVIGDVAGDLVLSHDYVRVALSNRAGNVVRRLPFNAFGTFSPDGQFLVSDGLGGKVRVFDLDADDFVGLGGLGRWRPTSARWSPTGLLVVVGQRRGSAFDDDGNPVRRFACRLPSGRCDPLPGRPRLGFESILPSSGLGQFFTLY